MKYAFTTGDLGAAVETVPYAYGDANWKDKLTAYNGVNITYDAIGNLTEYSGWTYEWEAGRRLKRQTQENTVVTYEYDHSGMRVRKTVSDTDGTVRTVYDYAYCGEKLAHMTWGSNWMHFFYDAQGRPAKVRYNGTIYSYIHNLQGDVVGIIDTDGNVVVEYKYDAWGFLLSKTGSMAADLGKQNPFRYRGYIYDEETWMYWLKSRYYYPELQRFINADSIIGQYAMVFEHNVFAYCKQNPITSCDEDGKASRRSDFVPGGWSAFVTVPQDGKAQITNYNACKAYGVASGQHIRRMENASEQLCYSIRSIFQVDVGAGVGFMAEFTVFGMKLSMGGKADLVYVEGNLNGKMDCGMRMGIEGELEVVGYKLFGASGTYENMQKIKYFSSEGKKYEHADNIFDGKITLIGAGAYACYGGTASISMNPHAVTSAIDALVELLFR